MGMIESAGKVACGFLLGTVGVAVLSSRDAKKVYTLVASRTLRCVDEVTRTVTKFKENCDDIIADAKEMNEEFYEEERKREIRDAKELIKTAESEEVPKTDESPDLT